ncbi:MAG: c-type cytochrome [Roseovarius sp.]|nr:c-type cytochrome [Roseovarius sp.]MCY4291371.1 c-type cytochrome [Roseovarius sp.]
MFGRCVLAVFLFAAGNAQACVDGEALLGEAVYGECSSCHDVGPGARNRIGPPLNGIFGRTAATGSERYRYSMPLIRAGEAGLVWNCETLDAYLADPRSFVEGTKMNYPGLRDYGDRVDLLAYLKQFSKDSKHGEIDHMPEPQLEVDLPPEILGMEGDPEYGEYLSSECVTCHGRDGGNEGIPSIASWPSEDFIIVMHAYKLKIRSNPVMQLVAGRLSDEEIAGLAAFFESIKMDY